MARFNKILVAVDGSDSSWNALRQAFKFAFDEKMWITVVAIDPPYEGDLALVGVANIGEVLKGRGEEILARAREIADQERALIKTRHEEGLVYEKIIDVANEEKCDLIVMGRSGTSSIERSLMGSVTAKVIGHFSGRALIVPRDAQAGWKNILAATDGSGYSEAAMDEAINYAASYGGKLHLINAVYTNDEFLATAPDVVEKMIGKARESLQSVVEKAGSRGIETTAYVREGEPFKVIVDLADELNVDTIVMGSHGRTGLKRILMGSVTSRVIGLASCPVMVVNPFRSG
jgi:nucleotide-binding universal stress UspA family protein